MNKKSPVLTGCLCALGSESIYGMSYMFTKQATELASPFALLGWRFLLAFVLASILVLTGVVKIHLRGKHLKPLLLVALFSPCIYFIAETVGINLTTASESGVFLACVPAVSLLASTCILHEKPNGFQISGILVTLLGVIVTVVAVGLSASLSVPGYAFLTAAVLSFSLYSVFVEKASDFTGIEITYVMICAGAVLFPLLAVIEALGNGTFHTLVQLPFTEPTFLSAVLYQSIGCSLFAFFLSNQAIAKIGVNRMSSFIGVTTVVSIFSGSLLLHEPFSPLQIIGAVVIIAGVYIANINKRTAH